jgi:hypothetical protein
MNINFDGLNINEKYTQQRIHRIMACIHLFYAI